MDPWRRVRGTAGAIEDEDRETVDPVVCMHACRPVVVVTSHTIPRQTTKLAVDFTGGPIRLYGNAWHGCALQCVQCPLPAVQPRVIPCRFLRGLMILPGRSIHGIRGWWLTLWCWHTLTRSRSLHRCGRPATGVYVRSRLVGGKMMKSMHAWPPGVYSGNSRSSSGSLFVMKMVGSGNSAG